MDLARLQEESQLPGPGKLSCISKKMRRSGDPVSLQFPPQGVQADSQPASRPGFVLIQLPVDFKEIGFFPVGQGKAGI
jgi:hypothetical protein